MSLKDRLNTNNKTNTQKDNEKNEIPKYFETSEIANIETLGILENLFIDDDLNSIYVNGPKNIYVERNGKYSKSTLSFRDNVQLENIIKRNAQNVGYEIDDKNPFIKFNHKKGINVQATLPPLSVPANIFIKCYKDKHANIKFLSENQSISKEMALILEALSNIKNNIIIAGKSNTLKTTVLSSLLKILPNNNKGILIDFVNEIELNLKNYSSFDFSNINENNEILDSIITSNPDILGINNPDDNTIFNVINKIQEGFKGAIITICAKNQQEAMNKIAISILKKIPNLNFEKAKLIAYQAFNLMIFCKKDETGKRRISSISQIDTDENDNCLINDIFFLNHILEHESTGFIPDFYEESKINSLPINSNIFEKTYKHTYHKTTQNDAMEQFIKKTSNQDILKRFKKELPTQEIPEEEAIKKVQEKFEELKKIAKNEEKTEETISAEQNQPETNIENDQQNI